MSELFPSERRIARFSECRRYRYLLEIIWDESLRPFQIIGLNPSTADEFKDDPTVRRCKAFAKREGCGRLLMTNLFAWRDTDPMKMKMVSQPVGERVKHGGAGGGEFHYDNKNDDELVNAALRSAITVAAWGNHGTHMGRANTVATLVPNLWCFRITKMRQPEHPLYMPSDQPLINYLP